MATTTAEAQNANFVEPPKIKIVNTLPSPGEAELGEIFLVLSTGSANDRRLFIRVTNDIDSAGYLKTAILT